MRLTAALLIIMSIKLQAVKLADVAKDALVSNTSYLSAVAGAKAVHDVLTISQAAWLPQVSLSANKGSTKYDESFGLTPSTAPNLSYGITLNQKLFDMQSWLEVKHQSILVQEAYYNAAAAKQDLIFQVANNYFNALAAVAAFENEQVKLKSYKEQLRTTQQAFNAGKAAQPELAQIKAQYLLARSELLAAKNQAMHATQKLSEITGKSYKSISGLSKQLPLKSPSPNKASSWLALMNQHNLKLKAARAAMLADEQEIAAVRTAGIPVVAFTSSWSELKPLSPSIPDKRGRVDQWGLSLYFPIATGGANNARVAKAKHMAIQTRQALIALQRSLTQTTNNAFNDINVGLERIRASQQAVVAANAAKVALQQGYAAGTQTITDVLQAIARLHAAKLQLIQARYAYITNILQLKLLIGSLSIKDLTALESLFNKRINLL